MISGVSQLWRPKIEDWLANFEDLTLIFKEIEDSFMCRVPHIPYQHRIRITSHLNSELPSLAKSADNSNLLLHTEKRDTLSHCTETVSIIIISLSEMSTAIVFCQLECLYRWILILIILHLSYCSDCLYWNFQKFHLEAECLPLFQNEGICVYYTDKLQEYRTCLILANCHYCSKFATCKFHHWLLYQSYRCNRTLSVRSLLQLFSSHKIYKIHNTLKVLQLPKANPPLNDNPSLLDNIILCYHFRNWFVAGIFIVWIN